jgi:ABC-type Fe3+/spermidine/putrescine transport system ATPase subunit
MIRLTDLVYAVGTFRLEVSLEVADGEYFVILGPTGSGKTAAVECLAGLRRPQSGRIEISGWDATRAEPRHRLVGYVPQDYALFTHRTVRRNISFGPEVRGWPRGEIARVVEESARLLGIEKLLDRRIQGLSGGERQRVALARALAMRPRVLVLDEPVSALDESTRETVCAELRRVQRELKLTTIHISHNLEEAFSVADRAAVIHDGRIEQVGRMEELLRRPRNEFVARFMRGENIFAGRASGPGPRPDTTRVRVGDVDLVVPGRREGAVAFVVRPENLVVHGAGVSSPAMDAAVLPARLVRGVDRGAYVRLELAAFLPLVAHMPAEEFALLRAGDAGTDLQVIIPPEAIHVLEE